MKKDNFAAIKAEFEKALNNHVADNLRLRMAVSTALTLMDSGADPKRCLETLREYVEEQENK
jgi:hypothetical protein